MGVSKCFGRYNKEDSETRSPFLQRFSCGVGSVLYNITCPLFSSFRLVFHMNVLGLSASNAGWIVLYGQASQAILSILAAFFIDRINIPFLTRKLGRRKSWHLIGAVLGGSNRHSALLQPLFSLPEQWWPMATDGVYYDT